MSAIRLRAVEQKVRIFLISVIGDFFPFHNPRTTLGYYFMATTLAKNHLSAVHLIKITLYSALVIWALFNTAKRRQGSPHTAGGCGRLEKDSQTKYYIEKGGGNG